MLFDFWVDRLKNLISDKSKINFSFIAVATFTKTIESDRAVRYESLDSQSRHKYLSPYMLPMLTSVIHKLPG